MVWSSSRKKVFCIGLNKTGTTSIKYALEELGFRTGNEKKAKGLFDHWVQRDFKPIIRFCHSADAFQDSPFSLPYTYIALDQYFKNAKFILTIRDNAQQWVDSLRNFHAALWGNGNTPTKSDLENAINLEKGRPWRVNRALFNSPEDDPYNIDDLSLFYHSYNTDVVNYFKYRQNDLLVINLSEKDSYGKMCTFLAVKPQREDFPHKNKTSDILDK